MVRNFDPLQFAPIRRALAPVRSAKSDAANRAGSFQKIMREQSNASASAPVKVAPAGSTIAAQAPPAAAPLAVPAGSTTAAQSPAANTPVIVRAGSTIAAQSPAAAAPLALPAPVQAAEPAAVPTAPPLLPTLYTIAALPNGGRMVNPTGNNALTGGTIPYNHDYYATQEAAFQLAAQLGGTVVDLGGHISNNQPEYFINLPNGITINAGNLLGVLNNATFLENSRVMDGKIAEVLNNNAVGTTGAGVGLYTVVNGHVTFDPNGLPPVYPVYTT